MKEKCDLSYRYIAHNNMNSLEKIAIFIPTVETGGVEKNAIWVSNELIAKGYSVDFLYVNGNKEKIDQLNSAVNKIVLKGYKFPIIKNKRINDAISCISAFLKYLDSNDNNNTIILSFQSSVISIIICNFKKFKVLPRLSNHPNAASIENSVSRKFSEYLKGLIYKKASAVIGNSQKLSEDFSKKIHKPVITIYNPVEITKINYFKNESVDFIKYDKSKINIIAVGRLARQKDYITMLKGFRMAKMKTEISLWIIGEGEERKNIEDFISTNNLTESVHLIGYQTNVYKYINQCDLYIQTSLYEGLPNSLIEALAVGLPVICTDCLSGPREILMDGKGGDLIEVGDYNTLAERILNFVENPKVLAAKSKYIKNTLQRFEPEKIIDEYLELMKKIVNMD